MLSFPPLHPAVVHFPIALIIFSVVVEFIAWFRPEPISRAMAKWTLVGACIGGVLTVAAGLIDINRLQGHNAYVHFHMQMGFILMTLLVGLTVWRWFIDRLARPIPKLYLAGAAMLLIITLFQGWLGGELVFSHGFAVAPSQNRYAY